MLSAMSEGRPPRQLRPLDELPSRLTTRQRKKLERRAAERRRITPQAFLLRVKAVAEARRQHDKAAMIGALEDLASAALAWANYIRKTGQM